MMFACERPLFSDEESALVARARKRDANAFTDLVHRNHRKIYRLAKRITQDDHDAEDVLQETFLKAYEHLASFQGHSKFSTWISRIAMNEALMKLRKRRSYPTVSLDEPIDTVEGTGTREVAVWDGNPEQQYSRSEMQRILEEALESLRPSCRIVFVLCDVEEFSAEETAKTLGISIPATKSRLFRARMALREKLTRRFKTGHADSIAARAASHDTNCHAFRFRQYAASRLPAA